MHAAETGERLYLPDKSAWSALCQEGAIYRVYLNFSALQANGERTQTRSYQFIVDLENKAVTTDDTAARQDFLDARTVVAPTHPPLAVDIDSLLGGIDTLNKHKLRAIMAKKSRVSSKRERKDIDTTVAAAEQKVRRAVIYFRTRYPEKALQNVAKAYGFTTVVNGGK